MEQDEDREIIEVQPTGLSSLGDVMSTSQLKAAVKTAESQRQIIKEFVNNQLVKGTDYGVIVGRKLNLLKPGQEKIFSLMKLTSRLEKDTDTLEMLGSEPGLVAYLCRVYRGGEEIAQGRGAAKVGENSRDANSAIKIAEKRARMDACLSLGFSEFFTQDMEDGDYQKTTQAAARREAAETSTFHPASSKQKELLMSLMHRNGFKNVVSTIKSQGIEDPNNMSVAEASKIIDGLMKGTLKEVPAQVDPETGEIHDKEQDAARGDGDAMALLAEERATDALPTDDEVSTVNLDEIPF